MKDDKKYVIRRAEERDLPEIFKIYADARDYMKRKGNPTQWGNGYPKEELLRSDMSGGNLYVCAGEKESSKTENLEKRGVCVSPEFNFKNNKASEEILAVFAFFNGVPDPNYSYIEDGAWPNDEPYGVIHRIAVSEKAHGKGIGLYCLEKCFEKADNLRIDTHRDNIPMQRVIKKAGFEYCGVVYMKDDGTARLAFMKSRKN